MKNIPKISGFEYTKVELLTREQKDLALQALGYALAEHKRIRNGNDIKRSVVDTFVSYLDRGLIL